jgi:hypothetical protein
MVAAASTTVPSGAQAGALACAVTGTPTAAGVSAGVMVTVTDSTAKFVTLTSQLTIRPEFTLTAPPLATNDGVVGRTYGVAPQASTATSTVSATVGNAPLTMCTFTGGTGTNTFATTVSANTNCAFHSTAMLSGTGSFMLTFMAADSPIVDPITGLTVVFPAGTNGNPAVTAGPATLTVDAALAINVGLPAAPMQPWDVNTPAAIQPYLNTTPSLTVTTTGGLPNTQTTYTCSSTGFAALGLTVASAAPNTPSCNLSGTPTATGTNQAVSISISDTGNMAVPALSPAVTTNSTLTINAQAVVTTTQAAFVAGVSTTDSAGSVAGRTYTVNVSAGTGAAPGTGTLTLSGTNLNAGNCAGLNLATTMSTQPVTSQVTGQPTVSVTAPSTATCSFSLSVTDGIATNTTNFTITINPPLRVSGPANLPDAVTDRTYNLPTAVVTITGGLPPYTSCTSAGQPAQITTSFSAANSCVPQSTSNPITTAGSPFSLTFTAMDTGDAATAAGSGTNASAIHLAVDAALTIATGLSTPMAPWTQNAAQPYLNATPSLTVTSTGGLPAAQTTYSCVDAGPVTFASLGLTVGPISSMTPPTCPLSGTPTATATNASVSIKIQDTGDSAVPAGSATTASTITINAQAMLTTAITSPADDGVSSTDSGGFVANRAYSLMVSAGTAGAPGTGNLTLTSNIGGVGNCAGLSLTAGAPAMTTVTGTISGNPSFSTTAPATTSCMFTVTVTDATNTAKTTNYTIVIHPPLRLSFAPAAGFGNGVVGHAFSQALAATGGINAVQSCAASGFPASNSLTAMFAAGTPSCTIQGTPGAGDTGTYTGMVTVMDGTDAATAGAGTASASSMFMINAALMVVPPARIVNGMNGFAYPSAATPVASVTYSSTGGTGGAVTFFTNATASGASCTAGAPANFPTGLSFMTLTATSVELQGTPTLPGSASTGYSFPVCATDGGSVSTMPYAVQTASNIMLAIFEPTSYASGTGSSTAEVIDTRTNTAGTAISLNGGTATPSGVAVLSSGLAFFTADTANNVILSNFVLTGGPGPSAALPVGCGTPVELATTSDPVMAGHDRLYATCPGVPEVAVYDVTSPASFSAGTIADIALSGTPASVAIQSNNAHAFVTLNDTNAIEVVDNTQSPPVLVLSSPFNLDPLTSLPTGIAVTANGASVYAYIGKQGFGNQTVGPQAIATATSAGTTVTATTTLPNGFVSGETVVIAGSSDATFDGTFVITVTSPTVFTYTDATVDAGPSAGGTATVENQQGVEVVDVTNVGTFNTAGTAPLVIDNLLTPGATPNPDDVAVDPTNADVYVSFTGTNGFTVLDNTVATPTQIAGNPFGLPIPGTAPGTDTPGGVTVPPVPSGTVLAYFTAMNTSHVDVVNQGTPPTANTTITGLTAGSAPGRIKNIPIPQ